MTRLLVLAVVGAAALLASISVGAGNVACAKGEDPSDDADGSDPSDPGEGEDEPLPVCHVACSDDTDCPDRRFCDEAAGVCGTLPCASDLGCNAELNNWDISPCVDAEECFDGYACIELPDGTGGCVSAAAAGECAFGEPIEATRLEGGAVTVCGTPFSCSGGDCVYAGEVDPQCAQDADCADQPPAYQACVEGFCGCDEDADCAGSTSGSVCRGDGLCGCADDSECDDAPQLDTCVDGQCLCSTGSCGEGFVCATRPENVDDD